MVAVENRGAVFPRSSKSSVSVRAINDEKLGDGAIFHHLTGHYPTQWVVRDLRHIGAPLPGVLPGRGRLQLPLSLDSWTEIRISAHFAQSLGRRLAPPRRPRSSLRMGALMACASKWTVRWDHTTAATIRHIIKEYMRLARNACRSATDGRQGMRTRSGSQHRIRGMRRGVDDGEIRPGITCGRQQGQGVRPHGPRRRQECQRRGDSPAPRPNPCGSRSTSAVVSPARLPATARLHASVVFPCSTTD